MLSRFPAYISSSYIEVQERASSAFIIIQMLHAEALEYKKSNSTDIITDVPSIDTENELPTNLIDLINEMLLLFSGDLNPVAVKAQKKVLLPPGLNLDEWINVPPVESSSSSEDEKIDLFVPNTDSYNHYSNNNSTRGGGGGGNDTKIELSDGEIERIRIARKHEQNNNPNYLKSVKNSTQKIDTNGDGCEDIPIAELALDIPIQVHCEYILFLFKFSL